MADFVNYEKNRKNIYLNQKKRSEGQNLRGGKLLEKITKYRIEMTDFENYEKVEKQKKTKEKE